MVGMGGGGPIRCWEVCRRVAVWRRGNGFGVRVGVGAEAWGGLGVRDVVDLGITVNSLIGAIFGRCEVENLCGGVHLYGRGE